MFVSSHLDRSSVHHLDRKEKQRKMTMQIQSPSINITVYSSIFNDILVYSWILMHIQPHSQAHNYGGEGRPQLRFSKIKNNALILEKQELILSIFGLNFSFKM